MDYMVYEPSDRDWDEDIALANGSYMNQCLSCENLFLGHKRRLICKICDGGTGHGSDY